MTVKELHAVLGTLIAEYGDKEVAHNYGYNPELYRVTSASLYESTGDIHGWPTFIRLGDERWPDAEWHQQPSMQPTP